MARKHTFVRKENEFSSVTLFDIAKALSTSVFVQPQIAIIDIIVARAKTLPFFLSTVDLIVLSFFFDQKTRIQW